MIDAFYWSRAASRAAQSQALDLELASLNPRGSRARALWLESAVHSAHMKRLYRAWYQEGIGQTLAPTHGARVVALRVAS